MKLAISIDSIIYLRRYILSMLYLKVKSSTILLMEKRNIYTNHSCIVDVGNGVRAHECDSLRV